MRAAGGGVEGHTGGATGAVGGGGRDPPAIGARLRADRMYVGASAVPRLSALSLPACRAGALQPRGPLGGFFSAMGGVPERRSRPESPGWGWDEAGQDGPGAGGATRAGDALGSSPSSWPTGTTSRQPAPVCLPEGARRTPRAGCLPAGRGATFAPGRAPDAWRHCRLGRSRHVPREHEGPAPGATFEHGRSPRGRYSGRGAEAAHAAGVTCSTAPASRATREVPTRTAT